MTVQIISGTKKLRKNSAPKPFNRVLLAFFGLRQRFEKKKSKISFAFAKTPDIKYGNFRI